MKTPVLFLIFNRPELTFRVFEEIRKAQPNQLYIAADGPRPDKEGEAKKCEEVRSILNKIDWKCEVKTLFRDKNIGCRDAVSSAINWFFDNVEEGIILEDDCLPDQSFFTFCEILLDIYRSNENIMHISGNNFQNGENKTSDTYYFSKHAHIWGWATWGRAWKKYDIDLNYLENSLKSKEFNFYLSNDEYDYWVNIFTKVKKQQIDTWDYQWLYSIWQNNGITILPNENLVTNIGFSEDATHTKEISPLAEIKTTSIGSKLLHPTEIYLNTAADENYFNRFLRKKNKPTATKSLVGKLLCLFRKQ